MSDQIMGFFRPDYFIHAANILLLIAYSVRDVLWLRLFAVAASLIAIPYYVLQPTLLWAPLAWSVVFAGINLFQSWLLFVERRSVKLTAEEEEIRRLAFQGLPPRKVLQVLSIGSWVTAEVGERLIEQNKLPDSVSLIVRGKVRLTKDGRMLGELMPGDVGRVRAHPQRHSVQRGSVDSRTFARHALADWNTRQVSQCQPGNSKCHAAAPRP